MICITFQDCVNRGGKLTGTGTESSTGDVGYLAAAFLFCCCNVRLMQICQYKGAGRGIRQQQKKNVPTVLVMIKTNLNP